MKTPIVFISYSHDSDAHKKWVLKLAADLRENGVDIIFDQWDLRPGKDIATFMEYNVSRADRVIIVCSENYTRKANKVSGGVGFEKMIITNEIVKNIGTEKFIPIVRNNPKCKIPIFLGSRLYIDFNNDKSYLDRLKSLLQEIHQFFYKPTIGPKPSYENNVKGRFNKGLIFDDLGIDSPLWARAHYLNFSLINKMDDILFIDEFNLKVLKCDPSKKIHSPCEGEIWKPFKFSVELTPDRKMYTITDRIFFYQPGDFDGFQIKITSKKNFVYDLQLEFSWHIIGEKIKNILYSPIYTLDFKISTSGDALKVIGD